MNYQRGGTVSINGYLLTLLIISGVASAATSLWLSTHRTIDIEIPVLSCTLPTYT